MVKIKRYEPEEKELWDSFVRNSKNGVFFFLRDYMEYHADRFEDHSLIFFKNEEPIALLPANVEGDIMCSHAGLTFGGIVTNQKMSVNLMLQIFNSLKKYLTAASIR